jgi:glycosyltransferase involved in cell wall biosynthesis
MILFSWNELPTYGAKLIQMAAAATSEEICVITTRAKVPVVDLEKTCGVPIIWVDKDETIDFKKYFSETPTIYFQAGWYVQAFNSLGASLRRNGVPVVLLSDNCFKPSIRQFLGRFYFRLFLRRRFDAVWVPGASGAKFMRNNGMPSKRIYDGLYGSDERIFKSRVPADQRERVIIFAGQLVARKGILDLVRAFSSLPNEFDHWSLEIYGNGPLLGDIVQTNRIRISEFVFPDDLAQRMGSVKIFCLPSQEDHWPLVVNEAALAGCAFVISDAVGNSTEFCTEQNSKIFKAKSINALKKALMGMIEKTEVEPDLVTECSEALGSKFDRSYFPSQFLKIVNIEGR